MITSNNKNTTGADVVLLSVPIPLVALELNCNNKIKL